MFFINNRCITRKTIKFGFKLMLIYGVPPFWSPLVNFYLSRIEKKFVDLSSDKSFKFYTRYVDDVFFVFINN